MNLRESNNALQVIGLLKSKEVKYGLTSENVPTITIDLVIASEVDNKIHENRVRLWTKETSKLYKSYKTVADEYKTIDEHGKENADLVKVTGSLEMNEYVSKTDGQLKVVNNLKGLFVNRVENKETVQEVGAVIECVVLGYADEISKEGMPTGRKKVNLFTVGYNNTIHELQNVFVPADVAQAFTRLYQPNSTGKLFIKVNNYVEVEENKEVVQQPLGFGVQLDNMPSNNVVKNYVNELTIVGGQQPETVNKYSMEEIAEMRKLRELARNEKINTPQTPPTQPSGFGTGFGESVGFENPFENPFA